MKPSPLHAVCLCVFVAVAVIWLADTSPVARAVEPPDFSDARFQVSAWAHAGNDAKIPSHRNESAFGAYVIDTHTGQLWLVYDNKPPRKVGSVGK